MKTYPSISAQVEMSRTYWVFDKLDGSNIRAEWSKKRGFYKFGSRTQLLVPDQAMLWPAVDRIHVLSENGLDAALRKLRVERVMCFFEWFGPRSFAGRHFDETQDMRLALLDLAPHKAGFMAPADVCSLADKARVPMPALLHVGRVDQDLLDKVRLGALPGMSFEGVVGKAAPDRKRGPLLAFKYKSQAWLDRLRRECGDDQELFNRLR